jgi:hypothetical protein
MTAVANEVPIGAKIAIAETEEGTAIERTKQVFHVKNLSSPATCGYN